MTIHFIGIGGIGISGLAKFMHFQGHKVSGSDIGSSIITKELQEMGIIVNVPHDKSAISSQDLVVHSAIIRPDNCEVLEAKKQNIEVLARREALLKILPEDRNNYAVAGAHGKSTTSAILSAIMKGSAIIGAESKEFKSNVRYDELNDTLVFEADESDGSFLNTNPKCAIVTNAEPEHMEYYDYNYELFYDSYRQFIAKASCRVINAEDEFLSTIEGDAIRLYPSKDIKNIKYTLINEEPHTQFELNELGIFEVWGLGEHIALDASLAILAAAQSMDIEKIRNNLLDFKGIKKRFDIVSKKSDTVIIDDYGHHPTEIKATLESVKTYAKLKGISDITAVWQPHKYSRTLDNLEAFIKCFEGTKELIILPVWSAGESKKEINFLKEFKRYNITMADSVARKDATLNIIKDKTVLKSINNGLIVGFGAGDITYQMRGQAVNNTLKGIA
jgi:UDP-N-acetylmuramate--alanine ligase